MTVKAGFQRSRRDATQRRDESVQEAVPPTYAELVRFGSPVKEFGADKAAYANEIGRLWAEAQDRFLKIGRYLVRAKERLPHGAFEAMVANELPFGRHVAWQLRTIATAVDGGRIEEDRLPNSYATAFKLATLADDVLELAKRENVVRPTVTRAEVTQFVRWISNERSPRKSDRERLILERKQLSELIVQLSTRLVAARERLSVLNHMTLGDEHEE